MRTAHIVIKSKDGKRSLADTKSDLYSEVRTVFDKLLKNPPAGTAAVELWVSDQGLKRTVEPDR